MAVSHPRLMAVWALLRPVVASSITPRFRPFSTAITARVPTAAVAGEGGECWWEVYQRLAFYVLWCALVYKFVLALRRPLAMVEDFDVDKAEGEGEAETASRRRSEGATASVAPCVASPTSASSRGLSGAFSSCGSLADPATWILPVEELRAGATTVVAADVLGEGGASVVYGGTFHGVAVAIKSPRASRGDRALVALRREAATMASLRHPNVLQIFGWRNGPDLPGAVLEVGEVSLFDILHDAKTGGPREAWRGAPLAVVLRHARDLAAAVAFLHSVGVAHRDVKSDNLLLVPGGALKLCDFGLAASWGPEDDWDLGDDWGAKRRYQRPVGTLAWMAPELHDRSRCADGQEEDHRLPPPPPGTPTRLPRTMTRADWTRCDVYSCGVVLFEIATGDAPFRGLGADAITTRVRSGERPQAPTLHASPVLESTIRACLRPRTTRAQQLDEDVALTLDVAPPPPPPPPPERASLGSP